MTEGLRDLLSGRKRGGPAALARGLLSACSFGYGLGVWLRNRAYDAQWVRIERASIPVVSLGNLTTGGTGKTPLAAFVARWFRERGVRVCFVSRGYGADAGQANDEALVLRQLCPDVPHLQNPDRAAAVRRAADELKSQLVILDDGFQHRRLARDLDIVLIDATSPWGFGRLLPRGLLREPVSAIRRSALAVITRVDQVSRPQVDAIRGEITRFHPQCAIAEVLFRPERLVNSSGSSGSLEILRNRPVAAFCGIGNPESFRKGLEQSGLHLAAFRSYSDHHPYSRSEIDDLALWADSSCADAVVTTQKDIVKIGLERLGRHPLWAVVIATQIARGHELLEAKLTAVLAQVRRDR
jgi:tetraacyldisaccharide 4'-kinase